MGEEGRSWARAHAHCGMPKQQGVLLAGCGGGYDVLACLPLFYRLKRQVAHPQPLCPNPRSVVTTLIAAPPSGSGALDQKHF